MIDIKGLYREKAEELAIEKFGDLEIAEETLVDLYEQAIEIVNEDLMLQAGPLLRKVVKRGSGQPSQGEGGSSGR